MIVEIDFSRIRTHLDLIEMLSPAFNAQRGDEVHFEINLHTGPLLPDHLLLVASTVNNLRNSDINISGVFSQFNPKLDCINYASRINFFRVIGFQYEESFTRHNPSGRFTEIKRFDNDNSIDVYNEVMRVLIANEINIDLLAVLHFCIWEVIDNTLNHSGEGFTLGAGHGFICAQFYPFKKEVRIMIADNGIGIHKALTTHPNSEYSSLTEREAVEQCIEKGVTNSTGKGFGLWATASMIQKNNGELIIHSGKHKLVGPNLSAARKTSNWAGTYTFLKINTEVPVYEKEIFGEHSSQRDQLEELIEDLNSSTIMDLW